MKGKILSLVTENGETLNVGEELDGYIIDNIEPRRDGHIGVNRHLSDESHILVTLVSVLSDKDKRYIAFAKYRHIIFEEVVPQKKEEPDVVMEEMG